MESTWLWVGTFGMAFGALAFLALSLREGASDPDREKFFVITLFIPMIAAAAYLAMAGSTAGWLSSDMSGSSSRDGGTYLITAFSTDSSGHMHASISM